MDREEKIRRYDPEQVEQMRERLQRLEALQEAAQERVRFLEGIQPRTASQAVRRRAQQATRAALHPRRAAGAVKRRVQQRGDAWR